MSSTERAAISKAWSKEKRAALLRGEAALLSGRILISAEGSATLLTWNPETKEFDRAPLKTENLSGERQRALYAFQDQIEGDGGNVVATDLVLLLVDGKPAIAQWIDGAWQQIKIQEIISRNR